MSPQLHANADTGECGERKRTAPEKVSLWNEFFWNIIHSHLKQNHVPLSRQRLWMGVVCPYCFDLVVKEKKTKPRVLTELKKSSLFYCGLSLKPAVQDSALARLLSVSPLDSNHPTDRAQATCRSHFSSHWWAHSSRIWKNTWPTGFYFFWERKQKSRWNMQVKDHSSVGSWKGPHLRYKIHGILAVFIQWNLECLDKLEMFCL